MNHYPKVIDVLLSSETDFRAIVIAIAKKHPKLVLDSFPQAAEPAWMGAVDAALRSDRKIEAIKIWRHWTGLGLKEAKDAVEARQTEKGFI